MITAYPTSVSGGRHAAVPRHRTGHVGLSVTDLDRSLAFYQEVSSSRSSRWRRRRPPSLSGRRRPLFLTSAAEREAFAAAGGTPHLALQVPDARGRPGRRSELGRARDAPLRRRRPRTGRAPTRRPFLHRSRREPARVYRRPAPPAWPRRGRRAVVRVLLMGPYHEGELEVQRARGRGGRRGARGWAGVTRRTQNGSGGSSGGDPGGLRARSRARSGS